jgi:hypothetical protein
MLDMSILTRVANRLWPRRLARDLQDEVEFHIDMRVSEHLEAGMSADEATKEAHQQFGHIDSVVADMRRERLASATMLFAMSALVVAVVVLWIVQQRLASTDLRLPAVAAAPIFRDPNRPTGSPPPPRPGPGPTWQQFVRQTRAFEALQKGPGTYRPGRLIDDKGRLINEDAKTR